VKQSYETPVAGFDSNEDHGMKKNLPILILLFGMAFLFACAGGQGKPAHRQGIMSHGKSWKNAEKRKPTDPIRIALYHPDIDERVRSLGDSKGLFKLLCAEFKKDPLVILVDQKKVDRTQNKFSEQSQDQPDWEIKNTEITADISVFTSVYGGDGSGFSALPRESEDETRLLLLGEVDSHYLPEDHYTVEKSGTPATASVTVAEYAAEILRIIKTKPFIPHAITQRIR
jgi:hypothetical protein